MRHAPIPLQYIYLLGSKQYALHCRHSSPHPMMPISRSSLDSIPLSIATVSVGTPDDPLEKKLQHITAAGFHAIELGFPDLLSFASSFHSKKISENDYPSLCSAGHEVKLLCKKHKLGIMMLQPFSNFEGWASGSKERDDAFARARGWIEIMHAVGTDMLQVPPPFPISPPSSLFPTPHHPLTQSRSAQQIPPT